MFTLPFLRFRPVDALLHGQGKPNNAGRCLFCTRFALPNVLPVAVTLSLELRPSKRLDGLCSVALRITYQRRNLYIASGKLLAPQHWNAALQSATPKAPNHALMRTYFAKLLADANAAVLKLELLGNPYTLAEIKRAIQFGPDMLTLEAYARQSIARRTVEARTVATYENTLRKLCGLLPPGLPLTGLTSDHIKGVNKAMANDGLHPNTRLKHLKLLRSVVNDGLAAGLLHVNPFHNVRLQAVASNPKSLPGPDLEKLLQVFTTGNVELIRRQFLWCCYTGLRYGDMQRVRWADIENGLLRFIPEKTTKHNIHVLVPLVPRALALMPPQSASPLVWPDNFTNQAANRILKDLAALANTKAFTFHASRHTFATNADAAGVPRHILKAILGHRKDLTTAGYIELSPEAIAHGLRAFGSL